MHDDDVFTVWFLASERFDESDRAGMRDDFQGQVDGRGTGCAITNASGVVVFQMRVKGDEHISCLLPQSLDGRDVQVFVKEKGIPLDFGQLQAEIVCLANHLQQFGNDVLAVRDFCLLHECGESTDVGYEEEGRRHVFHSSIDGGRQNG